MSRCRNLLNYQFQICGLKKISVSEVDRLMDEKNNLKRELFSDLKLEETSEGAKQLNSYKVSGSSSLEIITKLKCLKML